MNGKVPGNNPENHSDERTIVMFKRIWQDSCEQMYHARMIYDADGNPTDYILLDINPAMEKFLNLSRDQAAGQKFSHLFPQHNRDWIRKCAEVVRTGQTLTSLENDRKLDLWYDSQLFSLGWGNEFFSILRDITDDQRAIRALAENEKKLSEMLKYAPAGIYEMDFRRRRFISVNDTMCKLTGYDREELLAMDPFDLMDEKSRKLFETRIKEWSGGNEPAHKVDYLVRTKDGREVWVELEGHFDIDEIGIYRASAAVCHDVTERKILENALREKEARNAFLLHLSDAMRPLSDPVEIQAVIARAAMDYFGADRCFYCDIEKDKTIIEKDAFRVDLSPVAGVYPRKKGSKFTRLIEKGEPVVVPDILTHGGLSEDLKRDLRNVQIASFIGVPIVKNGFLAGIFFINQTTSREWTDFEVILARDIAQRMWAAVERAKGERKEKEAQTLLHRINQQTLDLVEKLRKADQNKNAFINMLSHELRNPLAAIMLSLDLLDKTPTDEIAGVEVKEIARRQGRQLTRLVDDLLDVTRIDQNKVTLNKEWIDINELVKTALEDYQLQFTENMVRVELDLTHPLYLEADPARLTQVVGNLLHNAAKFTSSNDLIIVSVSRDLITREAVISVRDTGQGIDPDNLANLFDEFAQVDQHLGRHHGGLGLGLAIVKGMVELHGGRVEAFSEGRDKGATFTIRLPLTEKSTGIQEKAPRLDSESNGPLRVLLIDDNEDLALAMSLLMNHIGHKAATSHNGTEGIARVKELRPDVVFCDIGLPGMSGYEVAQLIRKDPEHKNMFLIALSGYAQAEDIARAKEAGFDLHLSKPLSVDTLRQVLNKVS